MHNGEAGPPVLHIYVRDDLNFYVADMWHRFGMGTGSSLRSPPFDAIVNRRFRGSATATFTSSRWAPTLSRRTGGSALSSSRTRAAFRSPFAASRRPTRGATSARCVSQSNLGLFSTITCHRIYEAFEILSCIENYMQFPSHRSPRSRAGASSYSFSSGVSALPFRKLPLAVFRIKWRKFPLYGFLTFQRYHTRIDR